MSYMNYVEKVPLSVDHIPANYNLQDRLLVSGSTNLVSIGVLTGAVASLRGRGSGFVDPCSGRESLEPLHVHIQHSNLEMLLTAKQMVLSLVATIQRECCVSTSSSVHAGIGFGLSSVTTNSHCHNSTELHFSSAAYYSQDVHEQKIKLEPGSNEEDTTLNLTIEHLKGFIECKNEGIETSFSQDNNYSMQKIPSISNESHSSYQFQFIDDKNGVVEKSVYQDNGYSNQKISSISNESISSYQITYNGEVSARIMDVGHPGILLSNKKMISINQRLTKYADLENIPRSSYSFKMAHGYLTVMFNNKSTAQLILNKTLSVGSELGITLKTRFIETPLNSQAVNPDISETSKKKMPQITPPSIIRPCSKAPLFESNLQLENHTKTPNMPPLLEDTNQDMLLQNINLKVAIIAEDFRTVRFFDPEKRKRLWDVLKLEVAKYQGYPKPILKTSMPFRGSVIVECRDCRSMDWLYQLVPSLFLWHDENNEKVILKAMSLAEFFQFIEDWNGGIEKSVYQDNDYAKQNISSISNESHSSCQITNNGEVSARIMDVGHPGILLSNKKMIVINQKLTKYADLKNIPRSNYSFKMAHGYLTVMFNNKSTAQLILNKTLSVGSELGIILKTSFLETPAKNFRLVSPNISGTPKRKIPQITLPAIKRPCLKGDSHENNFQLENDTNPLNIPPLLEDSYKDMVLQNINLKVAIIAEDFRMVRFFDPEKRKRLWDVLKLEVAKYQGYPKPILKTSMPFRGSVIVECRDYRSMDWLYQLVPTLFLWYNRNNEKVVLRAVPLSEFVSTTKILIRIPNANKKDDKILKKLFDNNDGLVASDWEILNGVSKGCLTLVTASVSFTQLEIIKKKNWKLDYGSSKIKVKPFIENLSLIKASH